MHCLKRSTRNHLVKPSKPLSQVGSLILSLLKMRKSRGSEVRLHTQGHSIWNLVSLCLKTHPFAKDSTGSEWQEAQTGSAPTRRGDVAGTFQPPQAVLLSGRGSPVPWASLSHDFRIQPSSLPESHPKPRLSGQPFSPFLPLLPCRDFLVPFQPGGENRGFPRGFLQGRLPTRVPTYPRAQM